MRNNITPCPSPLGTNRERLYLVRRPGPTMALDQELDDLPPGNSNGASDDDLSDKIHQLLDGKLDSADIEALIQLIQPTDDEPQPTQDRRRQARDRAVLATDALLRRRVAQGAQARARLDVAETADLMKRFPALKNARVVG